MAATPPGGPIHRSSIEGKRDAPSSGITFGAATQGYIGGAAPVPAVPMAAAPSTASASGIMFERPAAPAVAATAAAAPVVSSPAVAATTAAAATTTMKTFDKDAESKVSKLLETYHLCYLHSW